jgi:hypothetical protein
VNSSAVGIPAFSVRIRVGPDGIEAEAPTQLFAATPQASGAHTWAVTNDGQHFLVEEAAGRAIVVPLTVVVNWQARLKK